MNDACLLSLAQAAAVNSYSPYSKIRIGAALLGENGKVYSGSNIENSSYGLTICAERSAVINAIAAHGVQNFSAIAIYSEDLLPMPCGACAQFISEFVEDIKIIISHDGENKVLSLSKILPSPFQISS